MMVVLRDIYCTLFLLFLLFVYCLKDHCLIPLTRREVGPFTLKILQLAGLGRQLRKPQKGFYRAHINKKKGWGIGGMDILKGTLCKISIIYGEVYGTTASQKIVLCMRFGPF